MKGKLMGGVEDSHQEGSCIKDHFSWTLCMESVCFSGQMAESSLEVSIRVRKTARARTCGRMGSVMSVNSKTMSAMGTAFCTMLTGRNFMASGKKEKSMEDVTTVGRMEQNTSSHTLMARKQQQDVLNQTEFQSKKSKTNTPLSPKRPTKE